MNRVIFVLFFACFSGTALTANLPEFVADTNVHSSLAKIASLTILQAFKNKIESNNIHHQDQKMEIKTPVIGLLPDPLTIDDFDFSIPRDDPLGEIIHGNLSVRNAEVTGLSSVKDDFVLNLLAIPAVVSYTLDSETVSLHGDHDISINISADSYSLVGVSAFEVKLVDFMVDLEVKVLVNILTNKITVTSFYFDVGFEDFLLTLGETLISGELIEWDIINKNVVCIIQVYRPILRDLFNPLIKEALRDLLKDCRLDDLIAGDLSCIGIGGLADEIDAELQKAFPALAGCKLKKLASGDLSCVDPKQSQGALNVFFESIRSEDVLDFECPNQNIPTTTTEESGGESSTPEGTSTPTTTESASSKLEHVTTLQLAVPLIFLATYF